MDYSKQSNDRKKRKSKQRAKKSRNKAGVIIFRVLLSACIIGGFAMIGIVFGAYMGIIEKTEGFSEYTAVQPQNFNSFVYDKDGNEIDRYTGEENREYVALENIPDNMKNAIIAIEDERFYSHNGVDLKGMVRAVYSTLTGNRQGASTITQQLIKNNITHVIVNDLETKIQEQYLAVQFEDLLVEQLGSKALAKDYILESYLNSIYLNHGLYGVQTASYYYFNGKDVSELTLSECAVMAAITNIPTYYTPAVYPENNRERQLLILNKMLELEFITQVEYDEAVADNVYDRITQKTSSSSAAASKIHDYYSDSLIEAVAKDLETKLLITSTQAMNMIYNGGLQIYTPKDQSMQDILNETFSDDSFFPSSDYSIDIIYYLSYKNTVTNEVFNIEEKTTVKTEEAIDPFIETVKDKYLITNMEKIADRTEKTIQPQAAMVIIDPYTGYVKAITGGRGEKTINRGFNRATDAERQPGSVFKVLAAYAPAIDLGHIGAGSVIVDEPYTVKEYNNYSPNNWTGSFKGAVTVREAVVNSMNVCTVKTMVNTGIDASFDYLLQFGFKTLIDGVDSNGKTDRGPATALGGITNGVTQLEVTAAYGTIANGGVYQKPSFYTKVTDRDGKVLLEYRPEENRREVLKSSTAYILTDIMKGVITSGTGGKAAFKNIKMPISGKTGTSQNTKDLTFVGFTPYYAAGIWLGHDTDQNIVEDRGHHMLLWSYVMEKIHENLAYKDFEKPNGIVSATVCLDSGKLAVADICSNDSRGSRAKTDIFAAGSEPSEFCDRHASIVIDSATGLLADSSTPADRLTTITGLVASSDSIASEYEIPEAMVNGDTTIKLNESYAGATEENTGDYVIDPITGELVQVTDPDAVEATPTPEITFPSFPSFYNTPAPTASPTIPNNNAADTTPAPNITATPTFSEVPVYTPPPVVATETPVVNNDAETPSKEKPPIIE